MLKVGESRERTLHTRQCLDCGYDGPELQHPDDQRVYVCPVCMADLYARPPMSYAQMEGLDDLCMVSSRRRAAHRWVMLKVNVRSLWRLPRRERVHG